MADDILDPARTALVFFDTLKVYAYGPDRKSLLPEARPQVEACQRLLGVARGLGLPVFYARGDHRPDGRDASPVVTDLDLARSAPPGDAFSQGHVWGTDAADIIDELAPQPGDYQIYKHRWSMFFQTELELSLRSRGIDTIVLAGGSTEVGVGSSAYAGRDLDLHIVLPSECQRSGRGSYVTEFFVNEVAPGFTRVRTLEEVIGMLRGKGAGPNPLSSPAGGAEEDVSGGLSADPPLDPRHTGLLLFDVLKGGNYDHDNRRLAPRSEATVAAAQRMLEAARGMGIPVFYAQADHREDGADWASSLVDREGRPRVERFGRSRTHPGSHHGSWEAEIIDELAPQPGDCVVRKHRWSAFHATHLELSLRTAGVATVLLVGSATNIGVASTAYAARDRDFNVVVLSDACRATTPEINAYFMRHVFPRLGRVRTVDQALTLLSARP